MRVAPEVSLSPEERARLVRQRRRHDESGLRARIVLQAAAGLTDQDIARRSGVHRQTVARWRGRFVVDRLAGLSGDVTAPRPGRIPEETVQAIVRATLARPGPGGRRVSTRRLAQDFGVSHMTVRRIWDSYGVRPVRFEPLPPRADPVIPAASRDVVGLYLNRSRAALAWTLRAGGTGAERATRREGPRGEGRAGLPDSGRVGLAFRPLGPAGAHRASTEDRSDGLLDFLARLERRTPIGTGVRVVATGVDGGDQPAIDRWRIRHPRFEVELVPDFAAWKDRAVHEIRELDRRPRSPELRVGPAEVSRSLARFLLSYRTDGPPFRWTAEPREVAAGRAAPQLRYQLSATGHPGFRERGPRGDPTSADAEDQRRASARSVLQRYLRVRAGERVTIESWTATLPEANAFVLETLRLGARPLLLYQDEPTYWAATTEIPARSLARLGEHRRAAIEKSDALVSFLGPSDRERFHALPDRVRFRLGEYEDALYAAASKAGVRSVQMAIGRVSEASARMYGVDAGAWRSELLASTLVDPRVLRRRAMGVARRLRSGRELRIRHPNGTDLALRLVGREPFRSDGTVPVTPAKGNWSLVTLPAGVVVVAVDELFAEGTFESNVETSVGLSYGVGEFRAGRWTFAKGRLRRFQYQEGETLFSEGYARAGEGRDRPGAVSIGLNEYLDRAPLLEDQGLGTVTLQIGRNASFGGRTRLPWWAWLNLRGADVTVDGRYLLKEGRLSP